MFAKGRPTPWSEEEKWACFLRAMQEKFGEDFVHATEDIIANAPWPEEIEEKPLTSIQQLAEDLEEDWRHLVDAQNEYESSAYSKVHLRYNKNLESLEKLYIYYHIRPLELRKSLLEFFNLHTPHPGQKKATRVAIYKFMWDTFKKQRLLPDMNMNAFARELTTLSSFSTWNPKQVAVDIRKYSSYYPYNINEWKAKVREGSNDKDVNLKCVHKIETIYKALEEKYEKYTR